VEFLNNVGDLIQNMPALAYCAVFVGGILSSASPCVLITIPLVIGFVGGYAAGDKRKALLYSIAFIIGLSITFTLLGMIASVFGRLFGAVGVYWKYIVALVAVIIGLHLTGLFNINFNVGTPVKTRHKGLLGAFSLGLLFGVVSSPCATPVLAVILTYVAYKGEILYGSSLLFVYAVGHCALMLVAGVFTGFAENFIQSKGVEKFSVYSKKLSGIVIIFVGIYILVS